MVAICFKTVYTCQSFFDNCFLINKYMNFDLCTYIYRYINIFLCGYVDSNVYAYK